MSAELISSLIVLVALSIAAAVLFRPAVANNPIWRATVTPLASIIGSGFLVLAPCWCVISVCYYLNLFVAFAMRMTPYNDPVRGKSMTTAVLLVIGALAAQFSAAVADSNGCGGLT